MKEPISIRQKFLFIILNNVPNSRKSNAIHIDKCIDSKNNKINFKRVIPVNCICLCSILIDMRNLCNHDTYNSNF